MINKVILVGRITKDPELRFLSSGVGTVSFTVACERQYLSQNGERGADFINCVAWRQTAEFISRYIKKGYMMSVEGHIQTRTYQDQQGQTRYVTEVVAESVQNLQPRDPNQTPGGYQQNNQVSGGYQQNNQGFSNQGFSNQGYSQASQPRPAYQSQGNNASEQMLDLNVTDEDLPF